MSGHHALHASTNNAVIVFECAAHVRAFCFTVDDFDNAAFHQRPIIDDIHAPQTTITFCERGDRDPEARRSDRLAELQLDNRTQRNGGSINTQDRGDRTTVRVDLRQYRNEPGGVQFVSQRIW